MSEMTNVEAQGPQARPRHGSRAKTKLPGSLARIGRYTLVRLVTIGIALVIGILLTIFIANWGGHLDEVKKAAISYGVMIMLREDQAWRLMETAERDAIYDKIVASEQARMGLDRPFIVRTPGYLFGALTLDLGRAGHMTSPSGSSQVRLIILELLPATLVLFGTANLLLFFLALFGALFLSRRYGSALDKAIIALAPTSAAPSWFYGIFLILIFAIVLGWLPFGGMVEAPPPPTMWGYALSLLEHLVLPVLAIVINAVFVGIYNWRTFFLIHSSEDFVEVAKAKGLSSRAIERKYVLRPTLPPIIMSFALTLIFMWMGAIVLETIFGWPGLGRQFFRAIGGGETAVIVGITIIFAYLLAMTLFIIDFIFALIDPRVKVGAKGRL